MQPVTSLTWSSVLRGSGETNFEQALTIYNSHPDVLAHDRGESGTTSISLDGCKRQAVRNWMERCGSDAYAEVLASTHDLAFNLGPCGENFAHTNFNPLRSTSGLEACTATDAVEGPLPREGLRGDIQVCAEERGRRLQKRRTSWKVRGMVHEVQTMKQD